MTSQEESEKFSSVLFRNRHTQPCRFYVLKCRERQSIIRLIEDGGGVVKNDPDGPFTIILGASKLDLKFLVMNVDVYSINFIKQSCSNNVLQRLDEYRLNGISLFRPAFDPMLVLLQVMPWPEVKKLYKLEHAPISIQDNNKIIERRTYVQSKPERPQNTIQDKERVYDGRKNYESKLERPQNTIQVEERIIERRTNIQSRLERPQNTIQDKERAYDRRKNHESKLERPQNTIQDKERVYVRKNIQRGKHQVPGLRARSSSTESSELSSPNRAMRLRENHQVTATHSRHDHRMVPSSFPAPSSVPPPRTSRKKDSTPPSSSESTDHSFDRTRHKKKRKGDSLSSASIHRSHDCTYNKRRAKRQRSNVPSSEDESNTHIPVTFTEQEKKLPSTSRGISHGTFHHRAAQYERSPSSQRSRSRSESRRSAVQNDYSDSNQTFLSYRKNSAVSNCEERSETVYEFRRSTRFSVSCIQKERKNYTSNECRDIIAFIKQNNAYPFVKGTTLWKTMEKKKVCERTWQSMKEHFLKRVLPKIDLYKLGANQVELFKKCSQKQPSVKWKDEDGIDLPGRRGWRRNVHFYKEEEDMKILNFIIKRDRYEQTGGVKLWMMMEDRNLLPDRSWHSMKERYRKIIFPNLKKYKLSEEEYQKFKGQTYKAPRKREEKQADPSHCKHGTNCSCCERVSSSLSATDGEESSISMRAESAEPKPQNSTVSKLVIFTPRTNKKVHKQFLQRGGCAQTAKTRTVRETKQKNRKRICIITDSSENSDIEACDKNSAKLSICKSLDNVCDSNIIVRDSGSDHNNSSEVNVEVSEVETCGDDQACAPGTNDKIIVSGRCDNEVPRSASSQVCVSGTSNDGPASGKCNDEVHTEVSEHISFRNYASNTSDCGPVSERCDTEACETAPIQVSATGDDTPVEKCNTEVSSQASASDTNVPIPGECENVLSLVSANDMVHDAPVLHESTLSSARGLVNTPVTGECEINVVSPSSDHSTLSGSSESCVNTDIIYDSTQSVCDDVQEPCNNDDTLQSGTKKRGAVISDNACPQVANCNDASTHNGKKVDTLFQCSLKLDSKKCKPSACDETVNTNKNPAMSTEVHMKKGRSAMKSKRNFKTKVQRTPKKQIALRLRGKLRKKKCEVKKKFNSKRDSSTPAQKCIAEPPRESDEEKDKLSDSSSETLHLSSSNKASSCAEDTHQLSPVGIL